MASGEYGKDNAVVYLLAGGPGACSFSLSPLSGENLNLVQGLFLAYNAIVAHSDPLATEMVF